VNRVAIVIRRVFGPLDRPPGDPRETSARPRYLTRTRRGFLGGPVKNRSIADRPGIPNRTIVNKIKALRVDGRITAKMLQCSPQNRPKGDEVTRHYEILIN
jgi:hypothetical protein